MTTVIDVDLVGDQKWRAMCDGEPVDFVTTERSIKVGGCGIWLHKDRGPESRAYDTLIRYNGVPALRTGPAGDPEQERIFELFEEHTP